MSDPSPGCRELVSYRSYRMLLFFFLQNYPPRPRRVVHLKASLEIEVENIKRLVYCRNMEYEI